MFETTTFSSFFPTNFSFFFEFKRLAFLAENFAAIYRCCCCCEDFLFLQMPGKHRKVPFLKATGWLVLGVKLMEINSNGCFPDVLKC